MKATKSEAITYHWQEAIKLKLIYIYLHILIPRCKSSWLAKMHVEIIAWCRYCHRSEAIYRYIVRVRENESHSLFLLKMIKSDVAVQRATKGTVYAILSVGGSASTQLEASRFGTCRCPVPENCQAQTTFEAKVTCKLLSLKKVFRKERLWSATGRVVWVLKKGWCLSWQMGFKCWAYFQ